MEYVDFDVEIGAAIDGTYEVRASALGAIARGVVTLPFDPAGGDALKSRLLALQVALLRSAGTPFRAATPESGEVESFGRELWSALFTNDIRARYEATRAAAGPGRGVRIRMSFAAPELAALPWEYTYDPASRRFVALAPKTPLVRFIEMDAITEPLAVELPLRILAMAVNPKDLAPLAIDRERQLLTDALRPLEDRGLVSVTWLEGRTREALGDALLGDTFHVFHFIGHGGYDEHKGGGLIIVEDAKGNARRLPANSMGLLLGGRNQLRLAILNSCESAKGDLVDVFSSAAATVVRSGTPAVIAMQFAITDEAAVEFSRSLYKAIGIGLPIDAALTEARISVATEFNDTLEWGTPVLYMQARDGVLFRMPVIPKVEHDEIDRAVAAAREADHRAREEEARRAESSRRNPILGVSPVEARPGAVMSISGSSFEPDATIDISLGGVFLKSATTDHSGGFATSVTVPGKVRGSSAMVATEPSGRSASYDVKIAARPPWPRILAGGGVAAILVVVLLLVALPGGPSLVVSAAEAHSGDIVSLSGSGFQPNSNVELSLGGVVVGSVVTDQDGAFVTSVTVPDAVAGSSAMVATEASGRAAQHAFEVLEPDPTSAQIVAVPSIVGVTADEAASLLRDACQPAPCLLIEVHEEAHPDAPPGTVHRQSPEAGSSVGHGETVWAFVAPIPPTPTPTAPASPTPTPTITPTPPPTPTPATVAEWALAKAQEIEAQGHPVGQPVGTTQPTDDGQGQYQRFTGAMVYLTPAGHVVLLRGGLLADWQNRGGGSAAVDGLGYPLAEEEIDAGGHPFQRFENGVLQCAPSGGCAHAVVQPVYSYWLEYQGILGYPIDDTRSFGGGGAIGGAFEGGVAYIEDGGFVAICTWDGQVLQSDSPPITDCQGVINIIKGG